MESRVFGKYTLLHPLARGGMADLYLARSNEVAGIERLLVIKVVSARYSADPSFTSMFEDEVRIAANLNHPNIGQVIDVGQHDGAYFLAMEYIHGRDLRQVLKRTLAHGSPVPVAVAVPVAARICAALQHAHDARGLDGRPLNIVHRDVSPSNVMITYEGQVKLVDFGIARAANRTALTVPGTIKGKLRYLSPEQVLGQPLDRRTDVFGLGVCLWETTCGQHCFEGPADAHIYEAIVKGRIRRPSSLLPGYPAGLERILLRALAVRPEERYPNAQAMQRDLEGFAAQSGIALSDLALARFMSEAFAPELAAWEEARQQGKSQAQHLEAQAAGLKPRGEHVVLVSGAGGSAGSPGSCDTPQPIQTVVPPAEPAATPPAPSEFPRRTILYGAPIAAPAAPPCAAATTLQVSPAGSVEVHPDGHGDVVPATRDGTAEDRRRTVIVGTGILGAPDEDHRPTVMQSAAEPAGAKPAAGTPVRPEPIRPARPASAPIHALRTTEPDRDPAPEPPPATAGLPRTLPPQEVAPDAAAAHAPEPIVHGKDAEDRRAAAAPEPIIGRNRAELEALRRQPAASSEADQITKPPLTGDWSAQIRGERASGTHPYFKEGGSQTEPPPGGSGKSHRVLLIALVVGVPLLGGLAFGGFRLLRRKPAVTPAPVAAGEARDAGAARTSLVRIESEPSGAIVFSLESGTELGSTPLALALPRSGPLRIELQRPGYRRQRLSLTQAGRHKVSLIPAPAADAAPPRAAAAPAGDEKPAPKLPPRKAAPKHSAKGPPSRTQPRNTDLVDPFK